MFLHHPANGDVALDRFLHQFRRLGIAEGGVKGGGQTDGALREIPAALEIGVDPAHVKLPKTFYRGKGCASCGNTGYFGRLGLFEVLDVTENIRKLIMGSDFSLDRLKSYARSEGMLSMFEDGLRKVERGFTTIEEVFRVIRE